MPDTIRLDRDQAASPHVATLTLCEKTMAPAFFKELDDLLAAIDGAAEYADVRALIITADDPRAFSYGLDLPKAFATWGELFRGAGLVAGRSKLYRMIRDLQRPIDRIFRLRVPAIAVLHGYCIGGGLDLASACDIRIAAADAKISLRETKIAIVADLGSLQRLPPIIGQGMTRELAFTGRDVTADEALAMRLVNAVHPTRADALAAAQVLAADIAGNAPRTVEGVKQILNRALERDLEAGLDHVATWNSAFLPSEDLAEAVSAFMARRAPAFKGR